MNATMNPITSDSTTTTSGRPRRHLRVFAVLVAAIIGITAARAYMHHHDAAIRKAAYWDGVSNGLVSDSVLHKGIISANRTSNGYGIIDELTLDGVPTGNKFIVYSGCVGLSKAYRSGASVMFSVDSKVKSSTQFVFTPIGDGYSRIC